MTGRAITHTHSHRRTNLWGVTDRPGTEMGPIPSEAAGFDTSCHNHPSWWWVLRGKGLGYFWILGTEYNTERFIWGSAPVSEATRSQVLQEHSGKGENPDQRASSCLFQHPTVNLFSSLWVSRKQGTEIATVPNAKL